MLLPNEFNIREEKTEGTKRKKEAMRDRI